MQKRAFFESHQVNLNKDGTIRMSAR